MFTIYIKTLYTDSQRGKFWFETNFDILIFDLCLDEVINEDAMVFGFIGFVVMTSPFPCVYKLKSICPTLSISMS